MPEAMDFEFDLLTEFRRELLKTIEKLDEDEFYTKKNIASLVRTCYVRAKTRCDEQEVSTEDES